MSRWTLLPRRQRLLVAVLAALGLVLAIGAVSLRSTTDPTVTITARFRSTAGLYEGNRVAVLGIPQGTVERIEPHDAYVEVTLRVPRGLPLPAEVQAIISAPNPVSDRTIELYPPYDSGPRLTSGAVIPMARTGAPVPVDTILRDLDRLAVTLGPEGVNRDGALGQVISGSARLLDGLGPDLRRTLDSVARTLPELAGQPGELRRLLRGLDTLTSTLARHDRQLGQVFSSVTTATTQLADERGTISAAITNLSTALTDVGTFVRRNRTALKGSLKGLHATVTALASDEASLRRTFSTAALGFENFTNAFDLDAPCDASSRGAGDSGVCPALFARLVLAPGSEEISSTYCRDIINTFIPLLASIPGIRQINQALHAIEPATTQDADCLAQLAVFDGYDESAPGAPRRPDLDLERHLR